MMKSQNVNTFLILCDKKHAKCSRTAVAGYHAAGTGLNNRIKILQALQILTYLIHGLLVTSGVSDKHTLPLGGLKFLFHVFGIG